MKKYCFTLLLLFAAAVSFAHEDRGKFLLKYCSSWKKSKPVIKYPKGVSQAEIQKRLDHFLACAKEFAPHWLKEFDSIDRAFGWEKNTYARISCFGIDYKKTPAPHECTSWIIMPDLTRGKQIILHKNRDSSSRYLAGLQRSVPGKFSWIGHGNYGSSGANCGINSKGLAVAMNSGDETRENSVSGFNTVLIARVLLEECPDAASAVKLLKKMIRKGAYVHGKSGSMWFIADRKSAYVVEHNAKYVHAERVKSGLAARGNAWHFPEMIVHSLQKHKDLVGNNRRVYKVREKLIHEAFHKKGEVRAEDCFAVSRITQFPEDPKCYPLCGKWTNAASTFVIDREFPEELSCAVFAFGPPRHTVYIPVPITLKKFPDELLSGRFSNEIFKRFESKKEWKSEKELQQLETQLMNVYRDAQAKARTLLKKGSPDARKQAAGILENAFLQNWKTAAAFQ